MIKQNNNNDVQSFFYTNESNKNNKLTNQENMKKLSLQDKVKLNKERIKEQKQKVITYHFEHKKQFPNWNLQQTANAFNLSLQTIKNWFDKHKVNHLNHPILQKTTATKNPADWFENGGVGNNRTRIGDAWKIATIKDKNKITEMNQEIAELKQQLTTIKAIENENNQKNADLKDQIEILNQKLKELHQANNAKQKKEQYYNVNISENDGNNQTKVIAKLEKIQKIQDSQRKEFANANINFKANFEELKNAKQKLSNLMTDLKKTKFELTKLKKTKNPVELTDQTVTQTPTLGKKSPPKMQTLIITMN